MIPVTLTQIGSITQNPTTAQTNINNNSTSIETAFESALDTSGDQMHGILDMNSNQILNLPNPITGSSPLRLQDLSTFTGGGMVTNIPAGGTAGQILTKVNSTDFDVEWTSQSNGLVAGTNVSITGSSPATIATVNNPVFSTSVTTPELINTGTLTLPTTTDTIVGRATTDTLTNKTLTSSGNTITLGSNTVSNSTGSGNLVYATSPALVTPNFSSVVNTGTLTLPTATDTLVARATTDVLTNKTISGASNTLTILGNSQITGNIPVTNLNSGTGAASTTYWRGDATWQAPPTGTVTALETLTASSSASLSTSVSWAGYSTIEFIFDNIIPATTNVNFQFQINSGGVQTTGYQSTAFSAAGSATINFFGPSTCVPLNTLGIPSTASIGISGSLRLIAPSATGVYKSVNGQTSYPNGAALVTCLTSGMWQGGTGAVTGATFTLSSGNIASGSIRVYGIV